MKPESEFPTINDAIKRLSELANSGLGSLAIQAIIVPDSTLQTIAKTSFEAEENLKPALMIELGSSERSSSVLLVSAEPLNGNGMETTTAH